jgi:hypothetical protein
MPKPSLKADRPSYTITLSGQDWVKLQQSRRILERLLTEGPPELEFVGELLDLVSKRCEEAQRKGGSG